MSTLSSSSTLAQVEAAYDDNASYEEDASTTKCAAFLTAARMLVRRLPEQAGTRESNIQFRIDLITKEIDRAQGWLQANGTGSGTSATGNASSRIVRASFRDFRC